jgi:hypothetical protein
MISLRINAGFRCYAQLKYWSIFNIMPSTNGLGFLSVRVSTEKVSARQRLAIYANAYSARLAQSRRILINTAAGNRAITIPVAKIPV